MAKSKSSEQTALAVIGGAVVVCVIWAVLTGSLWQFVPVVGGAAVVLGAIRAMNAKEKK